ncbi:MAG: NnrU family protein [Geminicoccales bacterium]
MSGWGEFIVLFLAFYASHMIPAQPAIRGRLTAALGKYFYLLLYALLSILLFVWLIGAAARAPFSALWERTQWQSLLPQVLMLPACQLETFGVGARGGFRLKVRQNPHSIPPGQALQRSPDIRSFGRSHFGLLAIWYLMAISHTSFCSARSR